MSEICNTIIPQKSPVDWRQTELFPLQAKSRKPQISSIPGVSPKDPKRYRVKLGDEILGDKLSLDEALKLAKWGKA